MKHSGDGLLPLNPCWLSPMEQHKSVLDLKELLTSNNVFTRLDSVNLLPHDFESMTNVLIYWHYDLRLTHWGRLTHICVGNLTIIGSDNGLSPGRHQVIAWTNVGILLIGPLGINFSVMLTKIYTFSFKKIHLKMSSGKWRPFCRVLNVLNI